MAALAHKISANSSSSSSTRIADNFNDLVGFMSVMKFGKFKSTKASVLNAVLEFEEKKVTWTTGDASIIMGQYVGAISLLGSNCLIVEEVRMETDEEVESRIEKYGVEGGKEKRMLVKFLGLENVYDSMGVTDRDAMKLWYTVPVFWRETFKNWKPKHEDEVIMIYVYKITTLELAGAAAGDKKKILVLGKGILTKCEHTKELPSKLPPNLLAEMFPYIPTLCPPEPVVTTRKRKEHPTSSNPKQKKVMMTDDCEDIEEEIQ